MLFFPKAKTLGSIIVPLHILCGLNTFHINYFVLKVLRRPESGQVIVVVTRNLRSENTELAEGHKGNNQEIGSRAIFSDIGCFFP